MEMRLVRLEEFGLADEHRVDHVPSFWKTLPRILPRNEVGPDDVLIDFGSGMGRVVVLAAKRYPFRRIIGVEISQQMHEIARRNVERNRRHMRCTEIELVNADVIDYTVPDDVTNAIHASSGSSTCTPARRRSYWPRAASAWCEVPRPGGGATLRLSHRSGSTRYGPPPTESKRRKTGRTRRTRH